MATRKFTDATGLTEFWAKVKALISNKTKVQIIRW